MTGAALVRLAWRELQGGFRDGFAGFRVLLAGLILGVAAVAASGSIVDSVRAGLAQNARALVGGDLEVSRLYRPPADADRAVLARRGAVSEIATTRVMVRRADGEGRAVLAEFKAVDAAYPLVGRLGLSPDLPPAAAFAAQDGVPGVAVAPALLRRLGVAVGDRVKIGAADMRIVAELAAEPDGASVNFSLGPRVLGDFAALAASGLVQPGSLITYSLRLRADAAADNRVLVRTVKAELGDESWRMRGLSDAAPGIRRFLDTVGRFLAWAGLTALLVGGVGVANAVAAVLDARRPTVAILKSQGATNRQIVALHGLLIGAIAAIGIVVGLILGGLAPWPAAALIGGDAALPVAPVAAIYPLPLARAAGFGIVVAALFTAWPLLRARTIPAAILLRDVEESRKSPISPLAWTVLALLGLAGLALAATTGDRPLMGLGFAAGAAAVLALLRGLAHGAQRLLPLLAGRVRGVLGRIALANLARPGAPMVPVMVSLGLGATVLAALAQVQGNVSDQVGSDRTADRPTYFFIDIQPDQAQRFADLIAAHGARIEDTAPMVRGRVVAYAGHPADAAAVDPSVRWVLTGDRGFTAAAKPPRGADIAAGSWWTPDAAGPPQVSVERGVAEGLGLKIGDSLTVDILGREITATVANLRAVRWTSLSMNFAFVFSPGVIDAAPQTRIATVIAPPAAEAALERDVADALPNVSAIRVADVLEQVQSIADLGGRAVLAVTGVTVLAGLLVLGGAVASGLRDRINEAVVLKVLGARRRDLLRTVAWEFLGIGAIVGLFSAVAGIGVAWAVVRKVMGLDWLFLPGVAAAVAAACVAVGLATGGLVIGRVLAARPAAVLRHL